MDVMLIDDDWEEVVDDPGTSSSEKPTEDILGVDDLMKLYQECFLNETICIFDGESSERTKFNTKCMNSKCKYNSELVRPPKFIQSYYQLPEGKGCLICRECVNDAFLCVKERRACLVLKQPIFEGRFANNDPVVILDSDDEEESKENLDKEKEEILGKQISTLVENVCIDCDMDFQIDDACDKLKNKLSKLMKDSGVVYQKIKTLDSGLYQQMTSMYEAYYPSIKNLPAIDIPNESSSVENKDVIVIDEGDEMPGKTSARKFKYQHLVSQNLEKYGKPFEPSDKPMPKVGENFYVVKFNHNKHSEWVIAEVEEVIGKSSDFTERYRVKMQRAKGGELYKKEVDVTMMAYFQPGLIKLDIGTRIIALHDSMFGQRKFHSGIIAELPTRLNRYRYLIFFDHGYSQYAISEEIRYIIESKKNVHEYFDEGSQDFIKKYLKSFPERPMLRVSDMELVSTEYKGAWVNARVMAVDASLIQVVFLNDRHEEWLYRGSPRLRPVFDKNRMMKKQDTPGKFRHRGTTINSNQGPFIQYEVLVSDDDSDNNNDENESSNRDNDSDSTSQVRAVARKSTTRLPSNTEQLTRLHYSPPRRTSERRMTRLDFGRVQKRYPHGILSPRSFRSHKCSVFCVNWIQYDELKTRGTNPLAIPAIYAFKRDIESSNVSYVAPCGKRLRNYDELLNFFRNTELKLTVDLFDFDPNVHIFDEFVVAPEHILIEDVTAGSEQVPIPCINAHDEGIPDLMEYMTERRGLDGVNLNTDPAFLIGCDCTDNCQDKSKCACWQQTISQAKTFNYNVDANKVGYHYKRLPELILTGIYECNSTCKCCRNTCLNRVVQHPLKIKLQLFKTKKKGWGTRCVNDIPAGTFICVYIGNILTEGHANETGRAHGDEYFAELDYIEVLEEHKENYEETVTEFENEVDDNYWVDKQWIESNHRSNKQKSGRSEMGYSNSEESNEDSNDFQPQSSFAVAETEDDNNRESKPSVRSYYGEDEAVYVMDAKVAGNIGRYLNHSCDPNIFVQNVFVDTHDLRFPWVSFFALKYISAGTELTWNYGYNIDSVPGKKLYCYCGAANCRRRLL